MYCKPSGKRRVTPPSQRLCFRSKQFVECPGISTSESGTETKFIAMRQNTSTVKMGEPRLVERSANQLHRPKSDVQDMVIVPVRTIRVDLGQIYAFFHQYNNDRIERGL